jgi:hypothetical protein
VVHEFAKLLKSYVDEGRIVPKDDTVYKAVAWNAEWPPGEADHAGRMRLTDYCPAFSKTGARSRIDHDSIGGYLETPTPGPRAGSEIHSSILNLFLRVLRLEGIANMEKRRPFTAVALRRYLRENHPEFCEAFLLDLHRWTIACLDRNGAAVESNVRATAEGLLGLFGTTASGSRNFLDNVQTTTLCERHDSSWVTNTCSLDGITIHLSTVHGVKGETHTATLYLESSYQKDGSGQKARSYESQRLAQQFMGAMLMGSEKKRVKQSAKMAYVGFSRPTHLLCFAVHQDRLDQYLSEVGPPRWKIVRLPWTQTEQ